MHSIITAHQQRPQVAQKILGSVRSKRLAWSNRTRSLLRTLWYHYLHWLADVLYTSRLGSVAPMCAGYACLSDGLIAYSTYMQLICDTLAYWNRRSIFCDHSKHFPVLLSGSLLQWLTSTLRAWWHAECCFPSSEPSPSPSASCLGVSEKMTYGRTIGFVYLHWWVFAFMIWRLSFPSQLIATVQRSYYGPKAGFRSREQRHTLSDGTHPATAPLSSFLTMTNTLWKSSARYNIFVSAFLPTLVFRPYTPLG